MQLIQKFSTYHTTSKKARSIEYIVIHYTAGTSSRGGSAAGLADYYRTAETEVSSDFIVDDTAAVQYNGDIKNRYTWHCGGSRYATKGGSFYGKCNNSNSIGVEICSTNSTGRMQNANDKSYSFTPAAVNNAVELVGSLMSEYGIPAERVIRHYDVNGKPCPGIIGWNTDSGSDSEWQKFKAALGGNAPALYYVQVGAFASRENAEKYLETVRKDYPGAFIKIL